MREGTFEQVAASWRLDLFKCSAFDLIKLPGSSSSSSSSSDGRMIQIEFAVGDVDQELAGEQFEALNINL